MRKICPRCLTYARTIVGIDTSEDPTITTVATAQQCTNPECGLVSLTEVTTEKKNA